MIKSVLALIHKIQYLISVTLKFFITKILPTSISDNLIQFFKHYQAYEKEVQVNSTPVSNYQKLLLLPSLIFVLSCLLSTVYRVEINLLGIPTNDEIAFILSYPRDCKDFAVIATCSSFIFLINMLPNQIKDSKRIIKKFKSEREEIEKLGVNYSRTQKLAMFTVIGKMNAKKATAVCVACAGGIVTADVSGDIFFGYRPINELSELADGVISKEEFAAHFNKRLEYSTIKKLYGIDSGQADRMVGELLKGKLKEGSAEHALALDVITKLGAEHLKKN